MVHSKNLEETKLWMSYQEKTVSSQERSRWVKEVYEAAAKYLLDVRLTFQNYTLHDETHILNVLDAMGGLLGDKIGQLSVGEMELLILAACLHDIGMVYTEEEKQNCYEDETSCKKFLRKYCPELLGRPAQEWTEDIRKWYLRTLHPFRLADVLQNEAWKELLDRRPLDAVPKRCMIAVCQAHGENPTDLCHNSDLEYLSADEADPLFCALLLRLADLLDFDDTRAPRVLYSYVACNEQSRAEWDKHQASAGFRYPASPSASDLPYKARCLSPGVEHAVRDFLDWVDEELGNCIRLQKRCHMPWQQAFPFPRAVLRKEIESEGYMSGDFCLTMDQTYVLELLTGENLYDNRDVFLRELLQNAIDATLLRGEMEPGFIPEQARIDLREWNDKEGNVWFRIDDQGIGMTLGMLQRYFLKVGNSYYNSRELERDLRDHGQIKKYQGISRFGIGFLSCFLCGDYAEVSTLYFDDEKNVREEEVSASYQTLHYGLRLQVTGLSGYYTLKNQAKHHQTEGRLPAPEGCGAAAIMNKEREGYRATPGTSIVLRLDPGKLGTLDLCGAVEKYLFGSRVPVYYNNKRIGWTYEEVMRAAHEEQGEKLYELTPKMKEEFDRSFPAVSGQYPKLAVTVIPLDTEEDQVLPELSGVLVRHDLHFGQELQWKVKDQTYVVRGSLVFEARDKQIRLSVCNKTTRDDHICEWEYLKEEYGSEKLAALEAEFAKYSRCPKAEDMMEAWEPFLGQMHLKQAWRSYHDNQQERTIGFSVAELGYPDIVQVCSGHPHGYNTYVYRGILAGDMKDHRFNLDNDFIVLLVEDAWKPGVDVSRSRISELPLHALLAVNGVLCKYQVKDNIWYNLEESVVHLGRRIKLALEEWRELKDSRLDKWFQKNLDNVFLEMKQMLQRDVKDPKSDRPFLSIGYHGDYMVVYKYFRVYLQDKYRMTIQYEAGQMLSFYEKEEHEREEAYDLFPPMMFCLAASDESRQYVCSASRKMRRGITADHPFVIWLLHHAAQLKQYYRRQFEQIVDCLCNYSAVDIIEACNRIRGQLLDFPERHGIDMGSFPKLGMNDFWPPGEE
jgi:hypothetical protein